MKALGWHRHTVCGCISIPGTKGGMKVISSWRESDGARVYKAVRGTGSRGWAALVVWATAPAQWRSSGGLATTVTMDSDVPGGGSTDVIS